MSQIMESMLNRGLTSNGSESHVAPQQTNLDFVKILWRWKWLPILGSLIGAGVGYMIYTKTPEQFQSFALVQVVSSMPTGMELYDPERILAYRSRFDESRAIKSQRVLGLAVKVGNLTRYFPGLNEQAIVVELMDLKRGVVVQPADISDRVITEQLNISYISRDPDAAQAVVNAVVMGYQRFLADEYQTVDAETIKYFTSVEQRLAGQLKELNEQYDDFQKEAERLSVMWSNVDNPIDLYFEDYMKKKAQIEQISMQRAQIKGMLQSVDNSLKRGVRPHDVLMMLNDESEHVKSTF